MIPHLLPQQHLGFSLKFQHYKSLYHCAYSVISMLKQAAEIDKILTRLQKSAKDFYHAESIFSYKLISNVYSPGSTTHNVLPRLLHMIRQIRTISEESRLRLFFQVHYAVIQPVQCNLRYPDSQNKFFIIYLPGT